MRFVNRIGNAVVYENGNDLIGQVGDFEIPGLTATTEEHATTGGSGSFMLPSGMENLEANFKWVGLNKALMISTSDLVTTKDIQVRFNVEEYSGTPQMREVALAVFMKGRWRNSPNQSLSTKSNLESESNFDGTYLRVEYDGTNVLEYDAVNYIYKVGGVDLWAKRKANLGMV